MGDTKQAQAELIKASQSGDIVKVLELLDQASDSNVVGEFGYTPLHVAAREGHMEVAALLIDRGANVEAVTTGGERPIHVAAKWGRMEVVTLLLDRGVNTEAVGKDGSIPLHEAARSGWDHSPSCGSQRGSYGSHLPVGQRGQHGDC